MKFVFIINPKAGKGKGIEKLKRQIAEMNCPNLCGQHKKDQYGSQS